MQRDFRLYELSDDEFERLVIQICVRWFGQGVTGFSAGRDGGRDGKFNGKANCFPSAAEPIVGHCVFQAKHVASPNKSCSDPEFRYLLKKEHPKIKVMIKHGICDHYILFTNRKLTGEADKALIETLLSLGLMPRDAEGNKVTFGDDEIVLRLHDEGNDGRLFKMAEF